MSSWWLPSKKLTDRQTDRQTDTWPKIWTLSGRLCNGCVRFVFKLSPFWKPGCQKYTFIFMLICFIDIFCNDKAICNIFIVFKHWQPSANKISWFWNISNEFLAKLITCQNLQNKLLNITVLFKNYAGSGLYS
jgi:hypothetical protein